ncbi:MAG: hypothetical protein IJK41_07240 [Muribaculaceae bacterium]|nr:hypothetical protein [Muribaculaceae bacterium]
MKIKCLLAALAISAVLSVPVQAQDEVETRHEIAITYGGVPNSVWIDAFTDIVAAMFGETHKNQHYIGPIGLEYFYHTSPLIGVGAVGVFATNNQDAFYKETKTSYLTKSYATIMPAIKFNWLRKHNWGMYTKLAIGGTYAFMTDEDCDNGLKTHINDFLFNFQASLLGVEAGNDHVRGFVELGVGEQGIALAGLRYKF